jgi:hypothetical protein
MTAILKHNLDMPWETSPAQEPLKLKKTRLTPRPFTIAPRQRRGASLTQKTLAPAIPIQRKIRANPAVLRALREAEMAVWNKAVPDTTTLASDVAAIPVREARKEIAANEKAELRLFSVLASIAAAAVVEGLWGLSALLDRWSAFADFVNRTFAAN